MHSFALNFVNCCFILSLELIPLQITSFVNMVGLKYGVNIVMGLYFCKINGCISEFDASFKVKKKSLSPLMMLKFTLEFFKIIVNFVNALHCL